ncbi:MAG TPA: DNA topoisomerase IB [Chloroflexota bacterium]|nr:DNA topoisomerase IB [Chloroflexota bacterium]
MTLDTTNPLETAAAAGLRYVTDDSPGIRRTRSGERFSYAGPDGQRIHDAQVLERIASLVIPPAWTDVWICPEPRGHIQATGRDARGRKQYLYHARWREVRDAAKYERLAAFGEALPRIRQQVDRDLRQHGTPHTRILATVVKLLEETSIRIGNDEYRRQNRSFGLTTLLNRHARVRGASIRFEFKGKSGKQHSVKLNDARLARIVKQCQDIPGQRLFQYIGDDGERHSIESSDVNDYLRRISGDDFTAKDFRTWNGTVLALRYLRACTPPSAASVGKRLVSEAIKNVAHDLGNTPAVCRKAYVHPSVVNAYLTGALAADTATPERTPAAALTDEERCVLNLLEETSPPGRAAA